MSQLFRKLKQQYKSNVIQRRTQELAQQLTKVLPQYEGEIPVLVVCYNNGVYVRNTVWQLEQYGIRPIILDNNSTDTITKLILEELTLLEKANVLYSTYNLGHLVGFFEPIYAQLPPIFAYTDPDLQFNTALPENFLEILQSLTEEFQVFKAGFALDLLEGEEIITHTVLEEKQKPMPYKKRFGVRKWEQQFWRKPIIHPHLELYAADIDTTFAVYNKKYYLGKFMDAIRVAGAYSSIHLPWFPKRDILSEADKEAYAKGNKSSNWT